MPYERPMLQRLNQEKRITVVFMNLYTEMGGGEWALYHLLKELDTKRFEPVLIVNNEGPLVNNVRQLGVRIEILPFETVMLRQLVYPAHCARAIRGSRTLNRFLQMNQTDVIHCGDVLSLLLLAPAIRRMKIPVVYSVIFHYEWSRMLAFNLMAMLAVKRIVANSDAVKHDIKRRTAIPRVEVETIEPGVDTSAFRRRTSGERNILRDELRLSDDCTLIGMAGRFDPAKGHLIFLQSAAELMKKRSDVKFVIAGGMMMDDVIPSLKQYHDRVKQYCHEAGLDDHVFFLGQRDDMPDVMRSLDVYVCPSLSEGFGLTVVEALASSVPVVTSRAVGAADLVANEPNVFLSETGDSSSFTASIEQALRYSKQVNMTPVSSVVQHLGWTGYARRFEQVYADVVAS